jgi:hypothetical protein
MGLYAQADKSQQVGTQLAQEARKMESTEKFQEGSLLVAKENAASNRLTAQAAVSRANALNKAGGEKGALTPKDVAGLRDKAIDNVNKDYGDKKLAAQIAAGKSGKVFNEETWKQGLITEEFNRLIQGLQTGRGVGTMDETPTGGKLGGGGSNINPDLWKNLQVVTPKK